MLRGDDVRCLSNDVTDDLPLNVDNAISSFLVQTAKTRVITADVEVISNGIDYAGMSMFNCQNVMCNV